MNLREAIEEKALNLGLTNLKITHGKPFLSERALLQERLQMGLLTATAAGNIITRTDPELALPGAASIICAALPYKFSQDIRQENRLARYARLRDYHAVLGSAMEDLAKLIQIEQPAAQFRISVDTGPLVERAAACRAGVGYIGKNCSLITQNHGSFVLLGALLTTVALPADEPLPTRICGTCRACLDACPTGALEAPYTLRETACLSYLTQKKGWIPREYRTLIKEKLWGCDVCQDVCPYNQLQPAPDLTLWNTEDDTIFLPDLHTILRWGNKEYRTALQMSALYWRGRTVLQRNALLMLGNRHNGEDAAAIAACLRDPRPVIRGHAAWALGEIQTGLAQQRLLQALEHEKDKNVQEEMKSALQV
jgi:epoxyqueuosine reductase